MSTKRRQLLPALLFVLALITLDLVGLLAGRVAPLFQDQAPWVTVRNTESRPLRSVVLYVVGTRTRFSHELGDISAGASAETSIRAAEPSRLEIEFLDLHGNPKRLSGERQFGPDFRGRIDLSIKEDAIETYDQRLAE